MPNKIQVSASILCADFTRLGDEVKRMEDAGVDMMHVDVMDGHFVPNISIGQVIVEAIRPLTKLPIETHLMIENPSFYLDSFADCGADIISVHAECYGQRRQGCRNDGQFPKVIDAIDRTRALEDIAKIKSRSKKVVMVLNPGTPMCLGPVLDELDGVLIMSVNPGFARQKFMREVLVKVEQLRSVFQGDIAIDGGVNHDTSPLAVKAGVNVLATASYLFGSPVPADVVRYLKSLT